MSDSNTCRQTETRGAAAATAREGRRRWPRRGGFTLVEFSMVVVITGIVALGLAAVVDLPADMIQTQGGDAALLNDVDRGLAELTNDVRWAKDVRSTDARTLEVDLRDGSVVTYSWSGTSGHPLVRTHGGESVNLVRSVRSVDFALGVASYRNTTVVPRTTDTTTATAAQWSAFDLLPGFTFLGRTIFTVVETVSTLTINSNNRGGIHFAIPNGCDEAFLQSITLPLARSGTGDLIVNVFEAKADKRPDRSKVYATANVPNAAIPVARADVVIRLTPSKRLNASKTYFAEVSGRTAVNSALLETRVLSNPLAILDLGNGLFRTTNAGGTWNPLAALLHAGQCRYSIGVQLEEDDGEAGDVFETVTVSVPVKVHLTLALAQSDGGQREYATSIPVENNLALVNQ